MSGVWVVIEERASHRELCVVSVARDIHASLYHAWLDACMRCIVLWERDQAS